MEKRSDLGKVRLGIDEDGRMQPRYRQVRRVVGQLPLKGTTLRPLLASAIPGTLAAVYLFAHGGSAASDTARASPQAVVCATTKGFHDGDTFACVASTTTGPAEPFVVRVAGLDAPETGQAYWRTSRDRLRELAGPGTTVSCYKEDRYHREVCRVRTASGNDVVATLLQEGLAWHSVEYAHEQTAEERERYAAAERDAKAKHLGLWQEPNPQPPWECRRARLQHTRCR